MNIKPFKITIPQKELKDLQDRIKDTRWPNEIKDSSWDRGVPLTYARKLAEYWLHTFDWRKQEAWLNTYDQFMAEIDGQP